MACGRQSLAVAGGFELVGREGMKMRDARVGQHHLELEHVIDRLAVQNRSRAAGIVGDHAAHGGAARRGDVGREAQAMRPERRVQFVQDDAWLDARPSLLDVYFQHAVEVLRGVELKARTDRLARL